MVIAPVSRPDGQTIREFYEEVYKPLRLLGRDIGTIEQYRVCLNHWDKFAGSTLVSEIDDLLLAEFAGYLLGWQAAPTVNKNLRHLRPILKLAHKKKILAEIPEITALPENIEPPQAFLLEEIEQVITIARNLKGTVGTVSAADWWESLLFALYDSGGRIGAVLATKKENLNVSTVVDGTRGWCVQKDGRWEVVFAPWQFQRFVLLDNLYECGTSNANLMVRDGLIYSVRNSDNHIVADTFTAVPQSPLAEYDAGLGKYYIPAGMCVNARHVSDPALGSFWEAINFNECSCEDEDSVSSSSFEESSSQSGSASEPESESPSNTPSSSSKSSAIVPANWSSTGYTALFVEESPEVRFNDVVIANIPRRETFLKIDQKFIAVCEPNSIEVCGSATDLPVVVGLIVESDKIHIRFADESSESIRIIIRLTGIRKGFRGLRLPDRTRKQFEQNERFINSAYDKD